MIFWGKTKSEDIMLHDVTVNESGFSSALAAVCSHFDLSKPIVCEKHLHEIENFRRTIFYPDDFVDDVSFDTLEIEVIPNKKKIQK